LEREKAVEIIKQIVEKCPCLHGKSITLMLKPTNGLSEGIQIQIDSQNNQILEGCVQKIAQINNLESTKLEGLLIVYKKQ
jgi:hypothetical protein